MATSSNQARIILSADDQSAAAFAAVSRRFDVLKGQVEGLRGRFDAVLGAATAALAAIGASHKIELLDQLDKLSEKTGLTVEQLSVLRYQGELANVPLEELAKGAQKLAKTMAEAAGGGAEASATFKAIGVDVKDSSGGLKPFDVLLGEVADKFAHYEDGPAKAALAQRLFGKSGADLIPLLNQGSEGLAKQKKEAQELGIVLGGDVAKNAAEFNDNLTRLKLTAEAAAIAIGGKLLPILNDLLGNYLEFKKQGLLGTVATEAAFGLVGMSDLSSDPGADIARLNGIIEQMRGKIKERKGGSLAGKLFGTDGLENDISDLEMTREVAKIRQRNAALENLGETSDAISRKMRAGIKTAPPLVPATGAADNAEAILKKQLEQRLKQIEDFGALQKIAIEADNQQAESAYAAGFLTVQQLFDRQKSARDEDLKNQLDAFDQVIAAQRNFASKALKPEDRIHAETAIQEAQSKRAKAQSEYDLKSAQAFEAERIAIQHTKDSYNDLGATILDLAGKTREAAQVRIDKQVRDAALLSGQAGGDPKLVTELRTRLQLGADVSEVQKTYNQLLSLTADREQAIALAATENGTGELDTLRAVGAVRQEALVQLQQMAIAAADLADKLKTPEAEAFARQLGLAFKKAAAEADPLFTLIRSVGKDIGDAVANDAEQAIVQWQGFRNLLSAIATDIERIVTRQLVTKPFADYLTNLLGGNGQSSGGGGILGQLFGKAFGLGGGATSAAGGGFGTGSAFGNLDFGGFFADGGTLQPGQWGIAGENGPERIYAGATPLQVAANAGGGTNIINFHVSGPIDRSTQNQLAGRVLDAVRNGSRNR
jgi:hypothetical protein